MIINNRADLDAASQEVRDDFLEKLAAGIYNWQWTEGKWVLVKDTFTIKRFGFTVSDFPNAPKPAMPDYNPDEVEAARKAEEAQENRRNAYTLEADPLFFKAQRGEATLQDWQDKVAEIKARFPKE